MNDILNPLEIIGVDFLCQVAGAAGSLGVLAGIIGTLMVQERIDCRASNADFEKRITPYRPYEPKSHRRQRNRPQRVAVPQPSRPRPPQLQPAQSRSWAARDDVNTRGRWPGNTPTVSAAQIVRGSAPVNMRFEDHIAMMSAVLRGDTGLIPAVVEDAGRSS